MASKLDTLRLALVKKDAIELSLKYGKDPFAHIPGIDPHQARDLHAFITPPVDFEKATSKSRNKPHYLLFIVDVLKRIQLMGSTILERTNFQVNNQISPNFLSIISLSKICLEHFEELTSAHPSLSVESFIAFLSSQGNALQTEEIASQIIKAVDGIINENPLYDSLFEPFIYHPTEEEQEFLSKHAFVCGALWNAHFIIPDKLHAKASMSRELRRLSTTQVLRNTDFRGYETYEELISDLNKLGDFSKIVFYLEKLYKGISKTKEANRGSTGSNAPRPRIRFIKASDNIITNDLSLDDLSIQIVRVITPHRSPDFKLDVPEDELVEEDYFQQSDDKPTFSIERRNLNSRQAISHIEKSNQFIRDGLTEQELDTIISSLEAFTNKLKLEKQSILNNCSAVIQISLSLCTGNSFNKNYRIRLISNDTELIRKTINLKKDCAQVYLPLTYKYLSGLDENHGQNYRTDDFICLNLPPRIQAILLKATNIWTSAKAQYEEINGALIEYSIHTTDQHLKSCLNSFNLDARLTAEFLQQAIQNIFFKVSNGDFWTLAMLSGNPRVIGATQLHYTTLANLKLFEDYQKGIKAIFKEVIEIPQKNSPNLFIGYGNPIRPIKSIVQKELNHLSSFLATRVGQDSIKLSTEELIETLNLVMLFVETYCSYFNAIRNVTNPYIGLQSIDHEGFCAIADKIIQGGYNTRAIPVLKPVEETLRQFEDYILSLMDVFRRKKLAKWSDFFATKIQPEFKWRGLLAPNRNFPGYFLISPELKLKAGERPKVKFIPYTRKAALNFYEGTGQFKNPLFLQLAPNANRHFLRSTLLERGVNPEYIDEFMGHRHFGTESWNHNSIFDPQDYRKTIKAEIYKVYGDFKISLPFKPNSKQVSDKTNTECPDTTQRHSNS